MLVIHITITWQDCAFLLPDAPVVSWEDLSIQTVWHPWLRMLVGIVLQHPYWLDSYCHQSLSSRQDHCCWYLFRTLPRSPCFSWLQNGTEDDVCCGFTVVLAAGSSAWVFLTTSWPMPTFYWDASNTVPPNDARKKVASFWSFHSNWFVQIRAWRTRRHWHTFQYQLYETMRDLISDQPEQTLWLVIEQKQELDYAERTLLSS